MPTSVTTTYLDNWTVIKSRQRSIPTENQYWQMGETLPCDNIRVKVESAELIPSLIKAE